MALPPLDPVPNLRRLLTPEEVLLYTVKFHYLRGWPWLLGALACFVASYWWTPALVPFLALFMVWRIPFHTNEVAVTDARLLMRTGHFRLLLEAIEDQNILTWKLEQNALGVLLHTGRVKIKVRDNTSLREVVLDWVWHPMTFLEALSALQDEKYRDAS